MEGSFWWVGWDLSSKGCVGNGHGEFRAGGRQPAR